MRYKTRNLFAVLAIIVLTLQPIVYAQRNSPRPYPPKIDPEDIPEIMRRLQLYFIGRTVTASINAVLLIYLLYTYYAMYRKTQSAFTLGLVIMVVALLLFSLSSTPIVHWLLGDRALLGALNIVPDLFTTIAAITLIYLSRQ